MIWKACEEVEGLVRRVFSMLLSRRALLGNPALARKPKLYQKHTVDVGSCKMPSILVLCQHVTAIDVWWRVSEPENRSGATRRHAIRKSAKRRHPPELRTLDAGLGDFCLRMYTLVWRQSPHPDRSEVIAAVYAQLTCKLNHCTICEEVRI
jgi:hypothetical protein